MVPSCSQVLTPNHRHKKWEKNKLAKPPALCTPLSSPYLPLSQPTQLVKKGKKMN